MSKKGKKFDAPDAPVKENQVEQIATNETPAEPNKGGNPNFVRKPGLYLQDADTGVQFKFDRRELPKKAAVAGTITINGVATPYQVTSNKGWTPEDKVIEYIWVKLPPTQPDQADVITGYITLDYLVPAASFNGKTFALAEGTASRANPERVPKSVEAEEKRKAAAKATLDAKKAATGVAKSEPAAEAAQAE